MQELNLSCIIHPKITFHLKSFCWYYLELFIQFGGQTSQWRCHLSLGSKHPRPRCSLFVSNPIIWQACENTSTWLSPVHLNNKSNHVSNLSTLLLHLLSTLPLLFPPPQVKWLPPSLIAPLSPSLAPLNLPITTLYWTLKNYSFTKGENKAFFISVGLSELPKKKRWSWFVGLWTLSV